MNSDKISKELDRTLLRYRTGLIDIARARQELYLLVAMLKAQEQSALEEKLERIEAVLLARR